MTNNLSTNSKNCYQAESFEVVVVKDPKKRPFLNVFHVSGQNIEQEKLGKIFGIIQVDDTSESSAYLPNMLTQIIKKEYFKNKNKDCGKSFELTLHKINLTLTELAQHEIVKWINNLNAAIGVIYKDEIHFTQIGKGRILLLKNKNISFIDNDSSKSEDFHPMKTFSAISAGKIEENSKLIFTLKDTFKTLNEEEIRRHFKTFSSDEFDNLISSTLRNEASNTGIVVINIKKQNEIEDALIINSEPEIEIDENINFFGKTKQETKAIKEEKIVPEQKIEEEPTRVKVPDLNKSPFENEPEIFFKEMDLEEKTESKKSPLMIEKIKEKIFQLPGKTKSFLKNRFFSFEKPSFKLSLEKVFYKIKMFFKKIDKNDFIKIRKKLSQVFEETKSYTKSGINFVKNKIKKNDFKLETVKKVFKIEKNENSFSKKDFLLKTKTLASKFLKKFLELFEKSKIVFKKYYSKKILAIIIIFILFITILLIVKNKKTKIQEVSSANPILDRSSNNIPETEKIQNLKTLITLNKNIKDSTFLKNDLFLLTDDNSLIHFSIRDNTQTEIILPEELKKSEHLSSMESLQLVFIIAPDQVYSYSPITNSFSKNSISMPTDFKSAGAGTYLTYLYLLDKNSNQIFRYHRATGGFGEPKKWLTEDNNFENAVDMNVNDAIYIASKDDKIQKYFQGKKEKEFNLEKNFIPDKIKTKINQNEIFALDKKQGKILKLSENNGQVVFFQDSQFKDANDFSIDFENKKIFIITKKGELVTFNY